MYQESDKLETEAELGLNQIEKIAKVCLAFWRKKVMLKYREEGVFNLVIPKRRK